MEPRPLRPRVSVIIRTRNRPAMLREALRDVFAQTYDDVEIVVVDDGDDHAEVMAALVELPGKADRLRVVDRSHREHGRAAAANSGIRAASGELLVLHDDDDAWKSSFLMQTVEWLDSHPASVAVSARTEIVVHRVDEDGEPVGTDRGLLEPDLRSLNIADMLRANRITTNSLLYRASVHDEIGYFDESLPVLEDWDFYLRLIAVHPIDLLPLPALAEWHHRPGLTGDESNSIFSLSEGHAAGASRRRDEQLRASFRDGWPGSALHLAYEMQRLEDTLRAHRDERERAHTDVVTRLDALSAQMGSFHEAMLQRTSITSFLRRLTLLGRRRRTTDPTAL